MFALCFCLMLPVASGCGDGRPKTVPVSGTVLIDGKPLTTGTIRVQPADQRAAQGQIQPDGRFTLTTFEDGDGCTLGTHGVAVVAREIISSTKIRWLVPKRYLDPSSSGLQVTIDGPTDDLKIELSWDGHEPFIEVSEDEGPMHEQ